MTLARKVGVAIELARQPFEGLLERHRQGLDYEIRSADGPITEVERYWTGYTVRDRPFRSAAGSLRWLDWRGRAYPLFHELMELWGKHENQVVLDYGCGPANDLVGFLVHGGARQAIGVDVSARALELARRRLALHAIDPGRVRLLKVSDAVASVPLPDASVDHIYCEGVLHHTSHPGEILAELRRILRPEGRALVMVYNHDSLFMHLFVAYKRQILDRAHANVPAEDAFSFNTDGEGVPISRPNRPAEFLATCRAAGFVATFRGGYFYGNEELRLWERLGNQARRDPRLASEHRTFLEQLSTDERGYPTWRGHYAGIGGVYELRPQHQLIGPAVRA